jgi:hypothetical protein
VVRDRRRLWKSCGHWLRGDMRLVYRKCKMIGTHVESETQIDRKSKGLEKIGIGQKERSANRCEDSITILDSISSLGFSDEIVECSKLSKIFCMLKVVYLSRVTDI